MCQVFVVHGGLFERKGVRLTHLEALKRFKEIPLKRETFEDSLFQVRGHLCVRARVCLWMSCLLAVVAHRCDDASAQFS
jgi:hypothetical protein